MRTEWSKKENERGNLNEAVEFILSIARDVGMAEDSNERDGIVKEVTNYKLYAIFECRFKYINDLIIYLYLVHREIIKRNIS